MSYLTPLVLTVDKNPVYPKAMKQLQKAGNLPVEIQLQQIKYLNSMLGQDHRFIKKRVRHMLGFQSFQTESTTQAGIEAMQMIKKGQPFKRRILSEIRCYLSIISLVSLSNIGFLTESVVPFFIR
ncbi:DDE-type integrase/transposase/recombinase [Bacillus thuringiensis]|uniref:DDE-type integrase/transposase/recombinase n=1 Tax=Bacillus thuringiensis TaxID=1428 RepID=UPI003344740F